MNDKYFDELRLLYIDFKANYKTRAEEQQKKAKYQVKTKGRKYDVFPYQEEMHGDKTKGKVVDEIEMKNDNFIFYFDDADRIVLVKEASTFLKRICDFECYEYVDGKVYAYYGSLSTARRICLAIYEEDKIIEKYSIYSLERYGYEKYVYKDNVLSYIEVCIYEEKKEPRKWCKNFYFDSRNNLKLIQCVSGKWRQNYYCTVKIKYKKLEEAIEHEVMDLYQFMLHKVGTIKESVIEVVLNMEENISDIDFFVEWNGQIQELNKRYNIPIREFPLDRDEQERIVNSVLKSIVRLWEEKNLSQEVSFRIKKDGVNILTESNILPRWLKKTPELICDTDTIQYQYRGENEKVEMKKIKEIYKDFKKSTNNEMSFPDLVDHFERMSKVVAEDATYEYLDDNFLMQAESIQHKNKLMFAISLIRQIPHHDEFYQLGMDVIYERKDVNKLMAYSCWSDDVEGDFFPI